MLLLVLVIAALLIALGFVLGWYVRGAYWVRWLRRRLKEGVCRQPR